MKWYTCIIHIPRHISPVQLFHTRAINRRAAKKRAKTWAREGVVNPEARADIEVPFVFEGRHDDSETKVGIISH